MLLPNKLFSYNQSVLSKLPAFLTALDKPTNLKDLYQNIQCATMSPMEFMEVLDCLYALNKIDIDNEGRLYRC
jgi:hypothetical protein